MTGAGRAALVVVAGSAVVVALVVLLDRTPPDEHERRSEARENPAAQKDLAGLKDRVGSLERRVDELTASLEATRRDLEESRKESEQRGTALRLELEKEREKERVDPAAALMAAATGEARPGAAEQKPEEMDAFAKEVAKGMRQGIRQEFRRIADLIVSPTSEGLEQRRNQLAMFARAFGNNAGLDQAQVATLERILGETDERAREELRPLLQGEDDYRKHDYTKIRKVTEATFVTQNEQFDREFPKEKSEKLKQQLEPVRRIFGAMLDDLAKEAAAPPDATR